ncbi:MAG: DUF72 domain-containing protein [Wenzhouxiangellaceae bacterium]
MPPAPDSSAGKANAKRVGRFRAGTSGWSYPDWKDGFYPEGVAQRNFLDYYAGRFPATELNASFYRLPSEKMIDGWLERTPERFHFCVKLSRLITHSKRLVDCAEAIGVFVDRLAPLAGRMGPVLAQLPDSVAFDADRVEAFLEAWRDRTEWTLAIEPRHPGWLDSAARRLLRNHDAIMVRADSGGHWPCAEVMADGDVYLRYHGREELYVSGYTPQKLGHEARRVAGWLEERRNVWAFFNNTDAGHAWRDAEKLNEFVARRMPEAVPSF